AKREAGKQYDFQLPSPEEESRIDGLADGEGDGAPDASLPPGKADPAARSYEALRAGLLDPVARLKATDPVTAQKVEKVMDAAAGLAAQGNYTQAVAALKEAGKALDAATSTRRAVEDAAPAGTVAAAVLRSELRRVRLQAVKGLAEVLSKARG